MKRISIIALIVAFVFLASSVQAAAPPDIELAANVKAFGFNAETAGWPLSIAQGDYENAPIISVNGLASAVAKDSAGPQIVTNFSKATVYADLGQQFNLLSTATVLFIYGLFIGVAIIRAPVPTPTGSKPLPASMYNVRQVAIFRRGTGTDEQDDESSEGSDSDERHNNKRGFRDRVVYASNG